MRHWPAHGSTSGELQVCEIYIYHQSSHLFLVMTGLLESYTNSYYYYRRVLCYLLPDSVGRQGWCRCHVWGSRSHCGSIHVLCRRDPDLGQEMESQIRTTSGRELKNCSCLYEEGIYICTRYICLYSVTTTNTYFFVYFFLWLVGREILNRELWPFPNLNNFCRWSKKWIYYSCLKFNYFFQWFDAFCFGVALEV